MANNDCLLFPNWKLKVNEMFTSIQGEGPSTGVPSHFIRLQGCNLKCAFCDSKYSLGTEHDNYKVMDILDFNKEFVKMEKVHPLVKNVVITGGEPLLQDINPLLTLLINYGYTIEIETNGTISPSKLYIEKDNIQFNVSPKSGHMKKNILSEFNSLPHAIFKFVIEEKTSTYGLHKLALELSINKKKVWIMPEGETKAKQNLRMKKVIEDCIHFGFNFSARLHVLVWDSKRGV